MHIDIPQVLAWLIAAAWIFRIAEGTRGLPTIPDLLLPQHDLTPTVSVTVIVPARNEQAEIGNCLQSLLDQDYPHLQIVAVDDRSTDQTGAIMDSLGGSRLRILHITELPPEWLGKTHAMAVAARDVTSDFILFTDGDILFRPDAIRRALANAVATEADHFVLVPTTIIRRWDEAALLAFFQIFGLWAARPWKVADPRAQQDAIGIGAFNLLRRTAYEQIGTFAALRMEIVEDLALARRVKRAGLRQRIAFGRGMVNVHWAAGVPGLINVMTKNIFSAFHYNPLLLLIGCSWLTVFCVAPFFAWVVPTLTLPALITMAAIAGGYRLMSRPSGLSPWNALLAPAAAATFIFALLRSMVTTLRQGGVIWRGTFYPLAALRRNTAPLFPRSTP